MTTRPGLGDILVEEGLIAREQLNQARRVAERLGSPLVSVLLEQALITEDGLVDALSRRLHMQLFDPGRTSVDLDAVREVPYEEANRYRLLPVQLVQRAGQRILRVAMVDPLDSQAIEDIEFSTASTVEPMIARPSQLGDAIRHHYRGVVTKVIGRQRPGEGEGAARARRPFGAGLEDAHLHTKPVSRVQQMASTNHRLDALLSLLVRKGVVTQDEYEEQLRSILHASGEGSGEGEPAS
jgi:hypothetical protein